MQRGVRDESLQDSCIYLETPLANYQTAKGNTVIFRLPLRFCPSL